MVCLILTSFSDPGAASETGEDRLVVFRAVRDEIVTWIDATFGDAVPA